jgi:hypothetical protein
LRIGVNGQDLLAALLAEAGQQPDAVGLSHAAFEVEDGQADRSQVSFGWHDGTVSHEA